jgi:hypothetical protein
MARGVRREFLEDCINLFSTLHQRPLIAPDPGRVSIEAPRSKLRGIFDRSVHFANELQK